MSAIDLLPHSRVSGYIFNMGALWGKKNVMERHARFSTCWTPSKHSGLNSLSPKLPSNSEMRMSTRKVGFQDLMSLFITVTWPFQTPRFWRRR